MDSGISCQHVSYSFTDDSLAMAVVCEAASTPEASRAAVGAQLLCNTTVTAVKTFVKQHSHKLFKGTPFTQVAGEASKDQRISAAEHELRKLTSDIRHKWTEKTKQHLLQNPLSGEEKRQTATPESRYESTLTAYVQHKDFWFALQTGSGRCMTFHQQDEEDSRIWQMQETEETNDGQPQFHMAFATDGTLPVAAFCCSESILKAYKNPYKLANFYVEILKIIHKDGVSTARQQLQDDLPILSRMGTMDDTAIAVVFNFVNLKPEIPRYILSQIDYFNRKAAQQQELIHFFVKSSEVAREELANATDRLEVLNSKIRFLAKEYRTATGKMLEEVPDYSQDIELGKEKI